MELALIITLTVLIIVGIVAIIYKATRKQPTFKKPTGKIACIDIETTGTDYNNDSILQLVCSIVDYDFNILEEHEWIVKHNVEEVKAQSDDFVKKIHADTGLWNRIETEGVELSQIDTELREVLNQVYDGKWKISILGNSVHFDMNFIVSQMPVSGSIIAHRVIDMSSILQFMRIINRKVELPKHQVSHDALDDIRWSIEQARYAEKKIKSNK